MILPDQVLDAAVQVSSSLGQAYGIVTRLVAGKPRPKAESGTTETVEMASEYLYETVYDQITQLREIMRNDLGVSDNEAAGEPRGDHAGQTRA